MGTRCRPVCTVMQQGEIESIPASSYESTTVHCVFRSYPPYLEAVSSICNLRMHHDMVIGTYNTWSMWLIEFLEVTIQSPIEYSGVHVYSYGLPIPAVTKITTDLAADIPLETRQELWYQHDGVPPHITFLNDRHVSWLHPQLEGPEFECSGPQLEGPEFEYSGLSLESVVRDTVNSSD
ncbi:hypothetical protein ANN_09514 [Periplaneta americana]|uniref:Uncharacterized protein n=1 Tax=Periplaneta americana TaxID=6978 RepID=A0ABQ8TLW3_PERAM|nr:hypothetical protein ANN_09514 [Periplaneta americana]